MILPISVEQVRAAGRRLCGDPNAQVVNWEPEPLWSPLHQRTVGVYRVSGKVATGARIEKWELVLKLVRRPQHGRPDPEVAAYRSGFLAGMRGGLRAPHCYGIDDLDNGVTAMWLEWVSDLADRPWPMWRFALVAQQLGELNGAHLEQGRLRWLPVSDPRSRLELDGTNNLEWLSEVRKHRHVRVAFPDAVVERLLDLWESRAELGDAPSASPAHGLSRGCAATQPVCCTRLGWC